MEQIFAIIFILVLFNLFFYIITELKKVNKEIENIKNDTCLVIGQALQYIRDINKELYEIRKEIKNKERK